MRAPWEGAGVRYEVHPPGTTRVIYIAETPRGSASTMFEITQGFVESSRGNVDKITLFNTRICLFAMETRFNC